jgi:hypothetical protein
VSPGKTKEPNKQYNDNWGGKRQPAPGKRLGRPATGRTNKRQYKRLPVELPRTELEQAAIEAAGKLTPEERLKVWVMWYIECNLSSDI